MLLLALLLTCLGTSTSNRCQTLGLTNSLLLAQPLPPTTINSVQIPIPKQPKNPVVTSFKVEVQSVEEAENQWMVLEVSRYDARTRKYVLYGFTNWVPVHPDFHTFFNNSDATSQKPLLVDRLNYQVRAAISPSPKGIITPTCLKKILTDFRAEPKLWCPF